MKRALLPLKKGGWEGFLRKPSHMAKQLLEFLLLLGVLIERAGGQSKGEKP